MKRVKLIGLIAVLAIMAAALSLTGCESINGVEGICGQEDCNCNGVHNVCEQEDCNCDGIHDVCENGHFFADWQENANFTVDEDDIIIYTKTGTCAACGEIDEQRTGEIIPDAVIDLADGTGDITENANGKILIKGVSNGERSIVIENSTEVYIADNTVITGSDNVNFEYTYSFGFQETYAAAVLVSGSTAVYGGGSSITINGGGQYGAPQDGTDLIYSALLAENGDLEIYGMFGDFTGGISAFGGDLMIFGAIGNITDDTAETATGIDTTGDLTISGTVGNITGNWNGINAGGFIIISGTVGNITSIDGSGGITAQEYIIITATGTVGNITSDGRYGNGIRAEDYVNILGTVGNITSSSGNLASGNYGNGIIASGINIFGMVGNITGGSGEGVDGGNGIRTYGFTGGHVTIYGTVGNITGGNGWKGGDGIRAYYSVMIYGIVGNITGGDGGYVPDDDDWDYGESVGGNGIVSGYYISSSGSRVTISGMVGNNTASAIKGGSGDIPGAQICIFDDNYYPYESYYNNFPKTSEPKPWVWF